VFSKVDEDVDGLLEKEVDVEVGSGTSDLVIVTALTLITVDAASTTLVGVTR
jgi:hypothetical protein